MSLLERGTGRPKKLMGKTINKELEANGLAINKICDIILLCGLIHLVDPT